VLSWLLVLPKIEYRATPPNWRLHAKTAATNYFTSFNPSNLPLNNEQLISDVSIALALLLHVWVNADPT
jgi:hypothetical protein